MKILLIIVFGWPILLNGSTFAALPGRIALELDVAGSFIIPYVPWIALAIFIIGMFLSWRSKKVWVKWVGCISSILIGNTLIAYPGILYDSSVRKIQLSGEPSREMRERFEERFRVKCAWYSNSCEGDILAVKVSDFSDDMSSYVKNFAEQVGAPNPIPHGVRLPDNLNN